MTCIYIRQTMKTVTYAEPSPGFAATPKPATSPPDTAWTPSVVTGQDSNHNSSEEESSVCPEHSETLEVYNTAMSKLVTSSSFTDSFVPLKFRLNASWDNTTELDLQKCQKQALQGCLAVCEVVAQNARNDLFNALSQPSLKESEDNVCREHLPKVLSCRF